ncbi:MAG: rRNA adenine N-6-methyltransferase family protein, partial [Mariprofundaceae bacterium]
MSEHHKQTAKKALGQHFLKSQKAIRMITEAVPTGASAIEIGPGPGAITEQLLERVKALTVIENDDRFAANWQERSLETEGLSVIHGDVLKELEAGINTYQPEWIIGNLPYNISGPLTAQLASHSLSGGMV